MKLTTSQSYDGPSHVICSTHSQPMLSQDKAIALATAFLTGASTNADKPNFRASIQIEQEGSQTSSDIGA